MSETLHPASATDRPDFDASSGLDDGYRFDPNAPDFLSAMYDLAGGNAPDRDDHAADSAQPPPDPSHGGGTPPSAPAPAHGSLGAAITRGACVAGHTLAGAGIGAGAGAATGAAAGAIRGAAAGAVAGTVIEPGGGTLVGAGGGAVTGAAGGAVAGGVRGAFVGSAAGFADGLTHCGDHDAASDHTVAATGTGDPGLTRPTGQTGGTPTGQRSTTEPGARPSRKAQVDSENQVADAAARAGYRTVQNPTDGPNPALTPERMAAEGLKPGKKPDLLIEGRIWDTYTPVKDDASTIQAGIRDKVEEGQTHRVVVDLRGTTQTPASVRAALRAHPIPGLKEVMFMTRDGLSRPVRP